MPRVTEIVDAFREVFGDPVAIRAVEGKHSIVWGKW